MTTAQQINPDRRINVRVSQQMYNKLQEYAHFHNISNRKLIEIAIKEKLKPREKTTLEKKLIILCRKLRTENRYLKTKIEQPKIEKQNDYVDRVKQIVNNYYNVDIEVRIRKQEFIIARAIYSAILIKTTKFNHLQIATSLGLERTTIYNCLSNHEDWYSFDRVYKKDFDNILKLIESDEQREANNN